MSTKTKLEQAVEKRASSLNPAQREIAVSQLSAYKQVKAQVSDTVAKMSALNATPAQGHEEARMKMAQRMNLAYEYNQLSTACSRIASELFSLLEDKE